MLEKERQCLQATQEELHDNEQQVVNIEKEMQDFNDEHLDDDLDLDGDRLPVQSPFPVQEADPDHQCLVSEVEHREEQYRTRMTTMEREEG